MIIIIDYGVGNTGSIISMINKIGYEAIQTADLAVIQKARKIILPGVGAYDKAMQELKKRDLLSVLNEQVLEKKKDILGICLGAQILGHKSEEGTLPGLGWIDMVVKKFQNTNVRVPHMGWNYVKPTKASTLIPHSNNDEYKFYFVHSYYMECPSQDNVIGITSYGHDFCSIINKDNIFGVQFHPEKSHKYGLTLLKNFIHA